MSVTSIQDRVIHMPANPHKFEFDKEVAPIFPDMAVRSIPNYLQFHQMHAELVVDWFLYPGASVLDVGASRGAFFNALYAAYAKKDFSMPQLNLVAMDISEAMCELLREDFPSLDVRKESLCDESFMMNEEKYDVINCTYVIQFLPHPFQEVALVKLASMLRPNGCLILGQKEATTGVLGRALHEQYIRFRMENGYTREEIEAKSAALANSMWPMRHERLQDILHSCGFREVRETTRHTLFSTLIAYK